MALAYFNTVDYNKLLLQANFTPKQTEALVEAQMMMTQAIITQVATPADLQQLHLTIQMDFQALDHKIQTDVQAVRSELKEEIQAVRSELKQEIQAVRAELKGDIQEVYHAIRDCEIRLQKQMFKTVTYGISINVALMSLGFGSIIFYLNNIIG